MPAVNQIEYHPYLQQKEVIKKMEPYKTIVEGWSPLVHGAENIFKEENIIKLSEKYKKTCAQIILRWHIQKGVVVLPKSVHYERIKENFEIFDFELTEEEMKSFDVLDGKEKRILADEEGLQKKFDMECQQPVWD